MSNRTPSPLCSCIICKRELASKGLTTHHERSHGSPEVRAKYPTGYHGDYTAHNERVAQRLQVAVAAYQENPTLCKQCIKPLSFEKRRNQFCSTSCAASFSNQTRLGSGWTLSPESRLKTAESVRAHHAANPRKEISGIGPKVYKCRQCKQTHLTKQESSTCCPRRTRKWIKLDQTLIVGPFSKLKICTCKSCSINFVHRSQVQLCDQCRFQSSCQRAQYRFRFNVYHYPDLFDLDNLNKVGFYAPGGKSGAWNVDGLSRDHRVSVADAIKFGYNSYYITHPVNCELMTQLKNDQKNAKSSISYETLIKLVTAYDATNKVVM